MERFSARAAWEGSLPDISLPWGCLRECLRGGVSSSRFCGACLSVSAASFIELKFTVPLLSVDYNGDALPEVRSQDVVMAIVRLELAALSTRRHEGGDLGVAHSV